MKEFIMLNWGIVLAGILLIAAVVILAAFGKKKIIYKVLYTLVTEAEKAHGKGEGAAKLDEVMSRFYAMIPPVIRIFITYGTLKRWIEQALTAAKMRWKREAESGE